MNRFFTFFAIMLLVVAQPTAAAETKVAIVASLTGSATIQSGGGEKPLRLFDWIPAGASIRVGPASRATIAFASGARHELGANAAATLSDAGFSKVSGERKQLAAVPPLPKIPAVAAGGEQQRAAAFRLRGTKIEGLYPNLNVVTLADATTLRFTPSPHASKYKVSVEDEDGSTLFEVETDKSEVLISPGILKPGTRYYWRVKTLDAVGASARGESEFMTLAADQVKARDELRRSLERAGDPASLALLAEIDRNLGLLDEAERGFRAAMSRGGHDPALETMLQNVRIQMSSADE